MGLLATKDLKVGGFYTLNLEAFWKLPCVAKAGYNNVQAAFPTAMVKVEKNPYPWDKTLSDRTLSFVDSDQGARFMIPVGVTVDADELARPPLSAFFATLPHGVLSSGCDPEIFVVDGRNRLIPAFEFLSSKDEAPFHDCRVNAIGNGHLSYLKETGKTYWDGFQAEFTTQPIGCHGYAFDMVRAGLLAIQRQAVKHSPKAKLSLKSVFRIPESTLQLAEPQYVALGCDPSANAYDATPFTVENPRHLPYRVAGGHLHFAIAKSRRDQIPGMVKALDLLTGIPTVAMFADIDDPLRRQFYGKAGEYRTPAHGLEYRVLSNAWLGHPAVGHMVWDLARQCVAFGELAIPYEDFNTSVDAVQEIINTCDVKAARKMVAANKNVWAKVMGRLTWGRNLTATKSFFDVVAGGVESLFPDYRKIETNWDLAGQWNYHTNGMVASWNSQCNRLVKSVQVAVAK
jgi:hypothetical protein